MLKFKALLTGVAVLVMFTISSVLAQEIEFKFDWPNDFTFYQNLTQGKVKHSGDATCTDITESRAKLHSRKTDSGHVITVTPIYMRMTRDGQPIVNRMFSLLTQLEATYRVDNDGQLTSIEGFDKLEGLMKAAMPPEVYEQMSVVFNEDVLVNKEMVQWSGRIGDFAGAVVTIGEVLAAQEMVPLGTGDTIPYYVVTEFKEVLPCGESECVRIKFTHDSNAENISELLSQFAQTAGEISGIPGEITFSDLEIKGGGERIIDPNTMLIQSETIRRTMKVKTDVTGEGSAMTTIEETREYTYEY